MHIIYVCTGVIKRTEVLDYEAGPDPNSRQTIVNKCNISAPTLKNLVEKIGQAYSFEPRLLFLPKGDSVAQFCYCRRESGAGLLPGVIETKHWEKGVGTLYEANYFFAVEKQQVEPIPRAEFQDLMQHGISAE